MGELISKQMAIEALKKIDQELWGIDIERSTVPEYIEHHEQIKAVRTIVQDLINKILDESSAQEWIPCSERLPEESGRYLISVLDGVGRRTTVAPYQPKYKAWAMTGRMAYWKVIAWMPLPEPWGGEL